MAGTKAQHQQPAPSGSVRQLPARQVLGGWPRAHLLTGCCLMLMLLLVVQGAGSAQVRHTKL